MERLVAVHLPESLAKRVDERAAGEFQTRAGMVRHLVDEGLRRRDQDAARVNIPYRGEVSR